jgi:hypothetical protein
MSNCTKNCEKCGRLMINVPRELALCYYCSKGGEDGEE